MTRVLKNSLKIFLLELTVYGVLVAGYYFLVLHFLGGWLQELFVGKRSLYAGVALALIVGQGILLEWLTRLLLFWITPPTERS